MGPERSVEDAFIDVGDDGATIETTWDRSDPDTITTAIVGAIADLEGVEPTDLRVPMHDELDPDALVRVLSSADGTGDVTVSFRLAGHEVTTSDDGNIVVDRPAAETLG